MFIGHFGLAFSAKAAAPKTSLGSLFLASQFIDLLWPSLLLLGFERVRIVPGITTVSPLDFESYPISHSLVAVMVWALLFRIIYRSIKKYDRGALVVALLLMSHWFLDLIVHRADLQLVPGSDIRVGFDLWASLLGTLAVELLIFAVGVLLYLRYTVARDMIGKWALWTLVIFLVAAYLGNMFGPPPPNVTSLAWVGQGQWLLILWGYWLDRHRQASIIER
ncbi:MAG TPA: hypothetical protein VEI96_06310 [Thermodesulfovibrionales bacterium]|nr:hypothetical protein [Thermodesulfovibrionales bacterium]